MKQYLDLLRHVTEQGIEKKAIEPALVLKVVLVIRCDLI